MAGSELDVLHRRAAPDAATHFCTEHTLQAATVHEEVKSVPGTIATKRPRGINKMETLPQIYGDP